MKISTLKTIIIGAAAAIAPALMGQQALAGSLVPGTAFTLFVESLGDGVGLAIDENRRDEYGWQYAIDSERDGLRGETVGVTESEIYGMAVRETEEEIWVAIAANMPITGYADPSALDGNIGWGDLFFNLDAANTNFGAASDTGSLYAIRFAGANDSGAPEVGVYGNVTAKSVTDINSGFGSLDEFNQAVEDSGGTPSLGDLDSLPSYYQAHLNFTSIDYGELKGEIRDISDESLTQSGYDASQLSGEYTIAFSFEKAPVWRDAPPKRKGVPEPSSAVGLALLGLGLIRRQAKRG